MKNETAVLGRRVDLNLMGVFEAVYQTRSLTVAGERLGLSQPAVSHALARLRHTLRDPLFVRTPRGVVPTPLADRIAPNVGEGLAIIRASFEPPSFDPATSSRLFTIAMGDIGEVVQLPPLMKAISAAAPGVRLRTVSLPPAQARVALAEGHVDFAISNHPARKPLHEEPLGSPGYVVIARQGHPFIQSRLTLAAYRKARHVLVHPLAAGVKHGAIVEKVLRELDAEIAMQVGHFFTAGPIVAQSDLVATVPWGLAKTLQRMLPLRIFKPPVALPIPHLALSWHERYHRDPANTWLREVFMRETRALYSQA